MSFLAPKPSAPPPPPEPVPTPEDPAVDEARRKQALAARLRQGRAATILTGSLGVTDAAPVTRKTLLGE